MNFCVKKAEDFLHQRNFAQPFARLFHQCQCRFFGQNLHFLNFATLKAFAKNFHNRTSYQAGCKPLNSHLTRRLKAFHKRFLPQNQACKNCLNLRLALCLNAFATLFFLANFHHYTALNLTTCIIFTTHLKQASASFTLKVPSSKALPTITPPQMPFKFFKSAREFTPPDAKISIFGKISLMSL